MSEQYKRNITLSGVTNQSDLQNTVNALVSFTNRTSSQINSELQRLERLLAQMQTATDTITTILSGSGSSSSSSDSRVRAVNFTATTGGSTTVTFTPAVTTTAYEFVGFIQYTSDGSITLVNSVGTKGLSSFLLTFAEAGTCVGILAY